MARRRTARRHARLLAVIEGQILPRLVIATGSHSAYGHCGRRADPTPENVVELARLLIEHHPSVAGEYLQVLRTQGASIESLWMQLVAPTARYLNQLASAGDVDPKRVAQAQQSLHALLEDIETRHDHERSMSTHPAGEFSHGA
jgi:hypothetical protein